VGGVGRYLRERNPRVRIVAVEPDSPLHGLEGLKHMDTAVVPEIYDPSGHDQEVCVATEDAYATASAALRSNGILVGHSAGAALHAAREVARGISRGVIVALLADGGERYLGEGSGR
jgi:cysteine synthase B